MDIIISFKPQSCIELIRTNNQPYQRLSFNKWLSTFSTHLVSEAWDFSKIHCEILLAAVSNKNYEKLKHFDLDLQKHWCAPLKSKLRNNMTKYLLFLLYQINFQYFHSIMWSVLAALLVVTTRADVRDRDIAGLQMKNGLSDSVHFKFKLGRSDKPSLVR